MVSPSWTNRGYFFAGVFTNWSAARASQVRFHEMILRLHAAMPHRSSSTAYTVSGELTQLLALLRILLRIATSTSSWLYRPRLELLPICCKPHVRALAEICRIHGVFSHFCFWVIVSAQQYAGIRIGLFGKYFGEMFLFCKLSPRHASFQQCGTY